MDISKIPVGHNPPYDVNVIIEITQGALPVKYELDKASGTLFVDRFLHTSMVYPANYGFIPHTLSGDGDPCDVLVVTQVPVIPAAFIRCRPVGVLMMEDEHGGDEKIIAVPVDKLNPYYSKVENYTDLPAMLRQQIAHFFRHYKELEAGKWVRVSRFMGVEHAAEMIMKAIARHDKERPPT
jgi:inorganic pyrophosphatase